MTFQLALSTLFCILSLFLGAIFWNYFVTNGYKEALVESEISYEKLKSDLKSQRIEYDRRIKDWTESNEVLAAQLKEEEGRGEKALAGFKKELQSANSACSISPARARRMCLTIAEGGNYPDPTGACTTAELRGEKAASSSPVAY
jgi:hypothetical protein